VDCDAYVCPLSLLLTQIYFDSNSNFYQGPGFFFFHFIPLIGPTIVFYFLRITHGTLCVVLRYFITALLVPLFAILKKYCKMYEKEVPIVINKLQNQLLLSKAIIRCNEIT
jgi:hypothetical protein